MRFLNVTGLSWHNPDPFGCSLKNIDFDVRSGEIVGVAGVAGNGQDELLALLSGEERLPRDDSATISFGGQPVAHLRPDARRKLGLAFVPAERLGHGAVPELSLADNALLTAFQQGAGQQRPDPARQGRSAGRRHHSPLRGQDT